MVIDYVMEAQPEFISDNLISLRLLWIPFSS